MPTHRALSRTTKSEKTTQPSLVRPPASSEKKISPSPRRFSKPRESPLTKRQSSTVKQVDEEQQNSGEIDWLPVDLHPQHPLSTAANLRGQQRERAKQKKNTYPLAIYPSIGICYLWKQGRPSWGGMGGVSPLQLF